MEKDDLASLLDKGALAANLAMLEGQGQGEAALQSDMPVTDETAGLEFGSNNAAPLATEVVPGLGFVSSVSSSNNAPPPPLPLWDSFVSNSNNAAFTQTIAGNDFANCGPLSQTQTQIAGFDSSVSTTNNVAMPTATATATAGNFTNWGPLSQTQTTALPGLGFDSSVSNNAPPPLLSLDFVQPPAIPTGNCNWATTSQTQMTGFDSSVSNNAAPTMPKSNWGPGNMGTNAIGKEIQSSSHKLKSMAQKENFYEKLSDCVSQKDSYKCWIINEIRNGCVLSPFLAEFTDDDAVSSSFEYVNIDVNGTLIPLFQFEAPEKYTPLSSYVQSNSKFDEVRRNGMKVVVVHKVDPHYIEGAEVGGRKLMRIYDPSKDPRDKLMDYVQKETVPVGTRVAVTWDCTDSDVLDKKKHDGLQAFHQRLGSRKAPSYVFDALFSRKSYTLKSEGRYNKNDTWHIYKKVVSTKNNKAKDKVKGRGKRARQTNEENHPAVAKSKSAEV